MGRCERVDLQEYRRDRGRPKKSRSEVIEHYLESLQLTEDITQDMSLLWSMIKVVDHKY